MIHGVQNHVACAQQVVSLGKNSNWMNIWSRCSGVEYVNFVLYIIYVFLPFEDIYRGNLFGDVHKIGRALYYIYTTGFLFLLGTHVIKIWLHCKKIVLRFRIMVPCFFIACVFVFSPVHFDFYVRQTMI